MTIPISKQIKIAFVYGSVAKEEDTAVSDIDVMLIGDDLSYADFFKINTEAESTLGRKINPTLYTLDEWQEKYNIGNHFVTKVIQQQKIFLVGTEDELNKLSKPC